MANLAQLWVGRCAVGFGSVLAILAFLVLPVVFLALLAVDGYYFPVHHDALELMIRDGILYLEFCGALIFGYEILTYGRSKVRFWEGIVLHAWFVVATAGASLAGLFFFFGVAGGWRSIIKNDYQASFHFIALFGAAASASLYPIIGRICLLAKTLDRGKQRLASGFASWSTVLLLLLIIFLSATAVVDAVAWRVSGLGCGDQC
jgi:hypothetical protein